jgi:hypothetical protein
MIGHRHPTRNRKTGGRRGEAGDEIFDTINNQPMQEIMASSMIVSHEK